MRLFRSSLLVLSLALAAMPLSAQSILVYFDQCNGEPDQFSAALSNMGLSSTLTTDETDFRDELTGGDWDLVLIQAYSNAIADGETIDALQAYVDGGGRVAMSNYDYPAGLPEVFEADYISSYGTPVDMEQWTAHPLFSTPNAIPDPLEWSQDTCGTDGGRFEPTGGGVAVAGYTGSPAADEAAIIVGNGGRTVLFGGILGLFNADNDGDTEVDGVEMAENIIAFLLAAQGAALPADVPTASEWGLLVLALGIALAGVKFVG